MITEAKGSLGSCERCGDEASVIVRFEGGQIVLCVECRQKRRDRRNRTQAELADYCGTEEVTGDAR